jgi:peptidoglycan/xylan/chitin deacetylase (PgdA/CDA1 family)
MPASVPVLMYHSIDDEGPAGMQRLRVTPSAFGAQLDWLRDDGYTTVTVSRLVEAFDGTATLPERAVALTFDDGFADFPQHALPLLEERGMVATLYVTTAYLRGGGPGRIRRDAPSDWPPTMTWRQVAQLPARGIEVGGHSHTHPELDLASRGRVETELTVCKRLLEDCTGGPVESFAYPYGYNTPAVRALARDLGYTSACAVKHALTSRDDDPYQLARVEMTSATTVAELAGWLDGRLRTAPCPDRLRSRGWAAVRRMRHRMRPDRGLGNGVDEANVS